MDRNWLSVNTSHLLPCNSKNYSLNIGVSFITCEHSLNFSDNYTRVFKNTYCCLAFLWNNKYENWIVEFMSVVICEQKANFWYRKHTINSWDSFQCSFWVIMEWFKQGMPKGPPCMIKWCLCNWCTYECEGEKV